MLIYDTEIKYLIPPKDGKVLPDFKYCKGWSDFTGMEIACVVTYDTARKKFNLFDEFMLEKLKDNLLKTDIVIGFNTNNFDNKILATYDIQIPANKSYDILLEIARGAGTPDNFKGLSLNAICQANFNTQKSDDGAKAPMLYQRNRFGELFDYCLSDVNLTKQILERIIDFGHIINPRNGQWIRVNRPR